MSNQITVTFNPGGTISSVACTAEEFPIVMQAMRSTSPVKLCNKAVKTPRPARVGKVVPTEVPAVTEITLEKAKFKAKVITNDPQLNTDSHNVTSRHIRHFLLINQMGKNTSALAYRDICRAHELSEGQCSYIGYLYSFISKGWVTRIEPNSRLHFRISALGQRVMQTILS